MIIFFENVKFIFLRFYNEIFLFIYNLIIIQFLYLLTFCI